MSELVINLLEINFPNEEVKDSFMEFVQGEEDVFTFDCVGAYVQLDGVLFKPVDDKLLYIFVTTEDVKGELLLLTEAYPEINLNYLVIFPDDNESITSMEIESGEVLSSQTIVGPAAGIITELARGGFAG